MKWLRTFENFKHMLPDFKDKLPNEITIHTNDGNFTLKKSDVTLESDIVRVTYHHSTLQKNGNSLADGEPDYVGMDFHIIQSPLKIITDVTYGDSIVSEFSITEKGIEVGDYHGINSKLDSKTHFGFSDNTIKNLITFYKNLGDFKLDPNDFKFIDKYPDSYNESIKIIPFNGKKLLILDKGSDRIDYLKDWIVSRGIDHDLRESLPREFEKYLGVIVCDDNLDESIKSINIPTLFIREGFSGFLKLFGSVPKKLKSKLHDNKILSNVEGELFHKIDTETNQFNFSVDSIFEQLPEGFKQTSSLENWPTSFEFKNFHGCLFNPEMSETTYQFLDNFIEILKPVEKELNDLKNTNI